MSKLSYEDKVNLYYDRKEGMSLTSLCQKYGIVKSTLQYLLRLMDRYGSDILIKNKNRIYSKEEKEEMINRVLINKETIMSVALDNGLTSKTSLHDWIKKYKENGYNIVERKQGRSPTMLKNENNKKETIEEENKRLKKENEYLKAELEYRKKLRAVVQARKNRQQKKK